MARTARRIDTRVVAATMHAPAAAPSVAVRPTTSLAAGHAMATPRAARAAALVVISWLGAAGAAAALTSPWMSNPQSRVRLISGDLVAARRGELRLGIQFRLAPGWHVYWKNSGDAGFAPVVTWKSVPGLATPGLLWPAPHRYELPGGLEAFGYAGEVVYPVRASIDIGAIGKLGGPSAAAGSGVPATDASAGGSASGASTSGSRPPGRTDGGTLRLAADLDYLVCEIDCVPYRYQLVLDQPLGRRAEPDPSVAALLDHWWREVPLDARSAGLAAVPSLAVGGDSERFELRLRGVAAAPGGADMFFETHPAFEMGRPRVRAEGGGLLFTVPIKRKDASAPLPVTTEIAWTATGLMRQAGRSPLALAERDRVAVLAANAPAVARAGATADIALDAATVRAKAASLGRRQEAAGRLASRRLRGTLAAVDPTSMAAAAAGAALLALAGWGLLLPRPRPADLPAPPARPAPTVAARTMAPRAGWRERAPGWRDAAGFLAMLLTLGFLYALSLEISAEGLAGVELALLAMGLLAWLRRRVERSRPARFLLAAALAACAIAPPLLAGRNRLDTGAAPPQAALSGRSGTSIAIPARFTFNPDRRSLDA